MSIENISNTATQHNIFDSLQEEIMNSNLPDDEKNRRLSLMLKASSRRVNIMLIGVAGAGKSSTINALFDMSVAKVGVGVDPETKEIVKYDLGNLIIWDTPGLGDGVEADKGHIKQIVRKLSETDGNGNMLIDLVLVVLDAGSKDLAVSYDVINNTLIPCLGKDNAHRILIGLNQADMAMKGRHWDNESNAPDSVLAEFLTQKSESVSRRVKDATGVSVDPVCYCAGYTDGEEKQNPYNLSKLLYYILMAVPAEKRLVLADKLNGTLNNWTSNDKDKDYTGAVAKSFWDSLLDGVLAGVEKGVAIGGYTIGVPGMLVGGLVGAVFGGLRALIVKPLSKLKPSKALDPLAEIFKQ